MDIWTNFFDYSSRGNLRDGFLHEWLLAFFILAIFGLIGLLIGWVMWRKSKQRYEEIKAANVRIRAKNTTA